MPRDGSGEYTVPNTFLPNTVMSASAVNVNFTDSGNELTNSLARDGQSVMSGQFKAVAGTENAPGISFGIDPDTGFRRSASDEMRWVGGGQDRMFIDSAGKAWFLGDFDVAGGLNLQGALSGNGVQDLAAIEALTGTGGLRRTGDNTWALDDGTVSFGFDHDANGSVIGTGVVCDIRIPYACTLTGWTIMADQAGSISIDVWRDTLANFPPINADSITNGNEIEMSGVASAEDNDLSDWSDVTLDAGDVLRFNIDSAATITRVTVLLKAKRFT